MVRYDILRACCSGPHRALHHPLLRQVVQLCGHGFVVVAEGAREHGGNLRRHLLGRRFAGFALSLRKTKTRIVKERERGNEGAERLQLVRNTADTGGTVRRKTGEYCRDRRRRAAGRWFVSRRWVARAAATHSLARERGEGGARTGRTIATTRCKKKTTSTVLWPLFDTQTPTENQHTVGTPNVLWQSTLQMVV